MMNKVKYTVSLALLTIFLSGCTPAIIEAVDSGSIEKVKKEVDNGSTLNVHYDNGFTPLLRAASNNNFPIVKYLVERGADVNMVGNVQYSSPLHWAASYGNMEMAKYLVEHGANVDVKNIGNGTPYYWACTTTPIQYEMAKYLASKGADVNFRFYEDNTYLIENVKTPARSNIVKCLVDSGANLDLQTNLGDTALHWAAYRDSVETVKYLIEKGARVDIKNNGGYTVFEVATGEAKNYLSTIKQKLEIKKQQQALEDIKKMISDMIAKQDFEGLKALTEQNPNYVNYIMDDELRLMLTGPKGMKVGDIRKLLKNGKSDIIVVQLIKRVQTPYKEFTLDEIDKLISMGLTDKTIAAMIEVSTELLKDDKKRKDQENYISEQKKISEKKTETKVIYQNNNTNSNSNQDNHIMNAIQDEAAKQLTKKLFEKLF